MFHRLLALFLIVALLLSGSALTVTSQASTAPAPRLHLQRGTFDARSTHPVAPIPELAAPAPGGYLIIQFVGSIAMEDRAALEKTGVTILEYLPDFAYLVRGTPDQFSAAIQLPRVYASTPLTLADKFAPALLHAFARGRAFTGRMRIVGWRAEPMVASSPRHSYGRLSQVKLRSTGLRIIAWLMRSIVSRFRPMAASY